jgi:CheY-like chemotaxis protein
VLVADDDDEVRRLLRLVLERDGRFEIVGEAVDGAEAVRMAEALQPDAVVLDLMMPGVSGLEALPRIRQAVADATVLMLTAAWTDEVHDRAIAAGAAACMEKMQNIGAVGDDLIDLIDRRS